MSSSEPPPAIRGYRKLRQGRVSLHGQVYLVTSVASERQALFADHRLARAAAGTIASQGLSGESQMLAWVVMPDHAHMLLQLGPGDTLSAVVGKLKSASARAVNRVQG